MKRPRKIGAENSETRKLILDATEGLIVEMGYAAISTRQVAKRIGVAPALIHYYFPTTDDLLIAVYRRTAQANMARLRQAFTSGPPPGALWSHGMDPQSTALTLEFMAMANHRQTIREEIASTTNQLRAMQAEALATGPPPDDTHDAAHAMGMTVLLVAVSQLLVMEKNLDIACGHDELRGFMERWARCSPGAGQ